jgi:glycosyltransferase involved in cell wall biosynthesis
VAVVHVVQNLAIGGLERVVLNLATHAHRDRFRPSIVCLGPGGPFVDRARDEGIEVAVLDKPAGFRAGTVIALARRFRRDSIRVVHCHNAAPLVYGAIAGRLAGAAVVYTAHGMKTSGARQPARLVRLGFVDDVVTVSDDAREIATRAGGIPASRVRTVVNGVDTNAFRRPDDGARATARRALGIGDDEFVFGIVARLSAAKDHANLIRAFDALAAQNARVRLLIVGDGELRDDIERRVRESLHASRIAMTGSRNDVASLVGTFDAFVLSSYT